MHPSATPMTTQCLALRGSSVAAGASKKPQLI
ncbi:hypothetical protein J2X19_000789 [Rhodoferax ferrireducens]|uniref:Uncharacterized protein n=1 Tax=Rhodoferax ferrireducens TaxID=192843 RepID=A0ABU2C465_9BURK|nr:hypothetical protein [Rhodoferax ferrireducens]